MNTIAYLTTDEEGSPAMLFFDKVEAATYCDEGEEPQALVLKSDHLKAIEEARVEAEKLLDAGQILANWAWTIATREDRCLSDQDCEILRRATTAWEDARSLEESP